MTVVGVGGEYFRDRGSMVESSRESNPAIDFSTLKLSPPLHGKMQTTTVYPPEAPTLDHITINHRAVEPFNCVIVYY